MATSGDTELKVDIQPFRESLNSLGFEAFPLKIGWYNEVVSQAHQLQYSANTLALVVLSTPSMFEKVFLPFLQTGYCRGVRDPIDQCVSQTIKSCVSECLHDQSVDIMFDYEMLPSRKPKFLAQTAAHVAGAARYYRSSDVQDPPWGNKMFGVCIHPRLGGWFAIRALLVLKGVEVGEVLQQVAPPDCVSSQEDRIELLQRFNLCWRDWTYRDIIPTEERYSAQQQEYFITPPDQRGELLKRWGFLTDAETETQISTSKHG
ncbi:cyanocobalamin reductase / alkylcobalamin dealkylase isoform X2 [Hemibagrus wyckioides]|uniref:cyanocobalamin reductase / alkylcobalamin dealkylase isoform X2 n=1 Tax=Hemibagrus wyckioides TaxID=337641 RepID=UPI00266C9AD7|nr:cyanocobalamin reductase / alkylcobalamin dealkylase isoform X2 [Hemibagrus wyckioides]